MIKQVFEKTVCTTECIYNSQAGAVVLMCAFIYKVSSLVGIMAKNLQSSTLWAYLILSIVDVVCLVFMYRFFRNGADQTLCNNNSTAYKAGLILLLAFLLFKGLVYVSYALIYLTTDLFTGITPVLLLLILLACVTYLSGKGIRSIARVCELTVILAFLLIIINLVFLKTEIDFGRNLPVFAMPPSEFFAETPAYGLWMGDLFPLLFVRIRNKRLPYFGAGVAVCWLLISCVVGIGVAMYGNALPLVSSLLVKIAGFNQLSLEIGRMEWTTLLASVVMGITQLSFIFWGADECCHRLLGTRVYVRVLYPIAIVAVAVFAPSMQVVADIAYTKPVGYACAALVVVLSVYFFALKLHAERAILYSGGEYVRTPLSKAEEGANEV